MYAHAKSMVSISKRKHVTDIKRGGKNDTPNARASSHFVPTHPSHTLGGHAFNEYFFSLREIVLAYMLIQIHKYK